MRALAAFEQPLKCVVVALGACSTLCIVRGWQLATTVAHLPFCLIWFFFA
ncbi:hypothetical protein [Silicimonas algicola]|nr:hypothetical protein [Silicimonas algicola]